MEIIPHDTTLEAARIQREIFRRMAPEKRLQMAFDMSDALRSLVADGVRFRYPEYSEEQVKLVVIEIILGRELFNRAYPGKDIQA